MCHMKIIVFLLLIGFSELFKFTIPFKQISYVILFQKLCPMNATIKSTPMKYFSMNISPNYPTMSSPIDIDVNICGICNHR